MNTTIRRISIITLIAAILLVGCSNDTTSPEIISTRDVAVTTPQAKTTIAVTETVIPAETTIPETAPETTIPETAPETTIPETVPETTIPETVPETTIPETVSETTVPETVATTAATTIATTATTAVATTANMEDFLAERQKSNSGTAYNRIEVENYLYDWVNQERINNGVAPIEKNQDCIIAADIRTEEMYINKIESHIRPDGSSCKTALKNKNMSAAENVSTVKCSDTLTDEDLKLSGISIKNSPAHYQNMLDPRTQYIGISVYGDGSYVKYCYFFAKDK